MTAPSSTLFAEAFGPAGSSRRAARGMAGPGSSAWPWVHARVGQPGGGGGPRRAAGGLGARGTPIVPTPA
jgi:hypothetical protein